MIHQFAISLKPLWQDEPNPFHCQNKPNGTVTVAGSFISSLNVIVLQELFWGTKQEPAAFSPAPDYDPDPVTWSSSSCLHLSEQDCISVKVEVELQRNEKLRFSESLVLIVRR